MMSHDERFFGAKQAQVFEGGFSHPFLSYMEVKIRSVYQVSDHFNSKYGAGLNPKAGLADIRDSGKRLLYSGCCQVDKEYNGGFGRQGDLQRRCLVGTHHSLRHLFWMTRKYRAHRPLHSPRSSWYQWESTLTKCAHSFGSSCMLHPTTDPMK